MGKLIWKAVQMIVGLWLQRRNTPAMNEITQKSMLTYVEGVKTLRSAVVLFSLFLVALIVMCGACAVLLHGIFALRPIDPINQAWFEISVGAFILLLGLGAFVFLTSQRLWIRTFKIDELVGDLTSHEMTVIEKGSLQETSGLPH